MTVDLTPEKRAALREEHYQALLTTAICAADECNSCLERWPCPTIRLLNQVEALDEHDCVKAERAINEYYRRAEAAEARVKVLEATLRRIWGAQCGCPWLEVAKQALAEGGS